MAGGAADAHGLCRLGGGAGSPICPNMVPPNFARPEPREAELGLAERRPGNCHFNLNPSAFFLGHSLFYGEALAGFDCISRENLHPHPWFEGQGRWKVTVPCVP